MRILFAVLAFLSLLAGTTAHAASVPFQLHRERDTLYSSSSIAFHSPVFQLRKPTLLQKAVLSFARWKLKKKSGTFTAKQKDWAVTSFVLGLCSFGLIFLGAGLALLAIPAAVLAIVFGTKSLKGNANTLGILGVILGGLFLALMIALIIALILILPIY